MMKTDRLPPSMQARGADFAQCEQTIRTHSKSFYEAFSVLPAAKRQSVYAIYAFCRAADDSVDVHQSAAQLAALRTKLDAFAKGQTPNEPTWRALEAVFASFAMDMSPFYDMLAGQQMDLSFAQPTALQDLESYCYYVAGSVGLMLLPVLCTGTQRAKEVRPHAVALGVAMQLTNLLRDVGEDLNAGRIYLPKELMHKYHYTHKKLCRHVVDSAFQSVWETLALRAEELYTGMERNIALLDEDSRLPTLAALYLYRGILHEVRENRYQCFSVRGIVPPEEKRTLVALAKASLGLHEPPTRCQGEPF